MGLCNKNIPYMVLLCPIFGAKIRDMKAKDLALKIQSLRKSAGLSQEELAHRAGIGRNTLQRIEGADGNPTIESLRLLEAVLHASLIDESIPTTLPEWASVVINRLSALEEKISPKSIPPALWSAWMGAEKEKWRQNLAMFFLTGKTEFLDKEVPEELRKRLLSGLQFYKMIPGKKAHALKK